MALIPRNVMEEDRSGGALCSFEMKTDLKLLLECLKFQMDKPDLQKDTLVAIRSICQNNSDACDYFRDIGGLLFIVSLVKCSAHLALKEVSFYTLGVLAESNVFCQQTLCTLELFEDVSIVLSDERSSVNLKRMSVFLLLVLVSNNKAGQVFVRESGCIDLLLLLFSSTTLAQSMLPSVESGDPQYQLWLSVCSALSACVNNPQNEENQKLCTSAFPRADKWLQHSVQPEIVRPVCSLIGLSVANNRFSQDRFVSVGGLDTLANVLLQLVTNVQTKGEDCKLAVVVSKTLDACIAENRRAVHRLSKYGIVSSLIGLLAHRSLDPEDRFSIVLTLGHCTEDCEPNQYELLRGNGLPLMIQVLTESQDDETHKAATFVLQNCRHTTEMLSLSLSEQTPNAEQAATWKIPENRQGEFWEKAKEIYRKIEYLQQQNNEDIANMEEPEGSRDWSPNQRQAANAVFRFPFINSHSKQQNNDPNPAVSSQRLLEQSNKPAENLQNNLSIAGSTEQGGRAHRYSVPKEAASQRVSPDIAAKQNSAASSCVSSNRSDSDRHSSVQESHTGPMCRDRSCKSDSSRKNLSSKDAATQTSEHHMTDDFLQPCTEIVREGEETNPCGHSPSYPRTNTARNSPSIRRTMNMDPMSLCAEIISKEISSVLGSPISQTRLRCSGCLVTGLSMNSRNCSNILQKCPHLCDNHRIVLQTEERYKVELRKLLNATRIYTPHTSWSLTPLRTGRQSRQKERLPHGILLTPMRKRLEEERGPAHAERFPQLTKSDLNLEQRKGSPGEKQEIINEELQSVRDQEENLRNSDQANPRRVTRKDFTQKEIADLLDGVRKFGHHWNAILWSYPFQKGRSNVDLAKKYKKLKVLQMCENTEQ